MSRTTKRMSKTERREQLLRTAQEIVRDEGTDALTLGSLAERAGVSRPIAYQHFGSRARLLIALYRRIDDRHVSALLDALGHAPRSLEGAAEVMSEAFMHCCTTTGLEWHAVSAALKGDEEMEAVQRELVDRYVSLYQDALAPYTDLSSEELRLRCVGVIGAAEAIAEEMSRGRTDEAGAAARLSSLIVRWIDEG